MDEQELAPNLQKLLKSSSDSSNLMWKHNLCFNPTKIYDDFKSLIKIFVSSPLPCTTDNFGRDVLRIDLQFDKILGRCPQFIIYTYNMRYFIFFSFIYTHYLSILLIKITVTIKSHTQ